MLRLVSSLAEKKLKLKDSKAKVSQSIYVLFFVLCEKEKLVLQVFLI